MDFHDWLDRYHFPKLGIDTSLREYVEDRMNEAYEAGRESRDEEIQDAYEDGYSQGSKDMDVALETVYSDKVKEAFMNGLNSTKEVVL